MKRNLPLIILLSSLVMGCTQHKTDMPRQLVKALPQYPAYAAANYIKGRVDVKFDIGADGTVTRIEFIRSEYSAAIFLTPICISFDTDEKRR